MKIEIVGDELRITGKISKPLPLSSTGKSYNIFTSNGIVVTPLIHEGQPVQVGLNVFIKNPDYVKPEKVGKSK